MGQDLNCNLSIFSNSSSNFKIWSSNSKIFINNMKRSYCCGSRFSGCLTHTQFQRILSLNKFGGLSNRWMRPQWWVHRCCADNPCGGVPREYIGVQLALWCGMECVCDILQMVNIGASGPWKLCMELCVWYWCFIICLCAMWRLLSAYVRFQAQGVVANVHTTIIESFRMPPITSQTTICIWILDLRIWILKWMF